MASLNCNTNTLILATIVIILVAFTDNIFHVVPVLKKLFTDKINLGLLIALAILILLIDIPGGIIITFLILYMTVYLYWKKRDSFTDVPSLVPMGIASDSEINYDHTERPPVINLPPFQPKSAEEIEAASPQSAMPCEAPRVLMPVENPNRDGFDVAGCRYDYQDNEQNLTRNGPPLAKCGAYSMKQFEKVGTLFYPLNG